MWQQLSSECLRTSATCTCSDKQNRVSSAKWVGAELPSSRGREIERATRGERKIGPYAIYIRALLHHTLPQHPPLLHQQSTRPPSVHWLTSSVVCIPLLHTFYFVSKPLTASTVPWMYSFLILSILWFFLGFFSSVPLFPNPTSHQVSLPSCKHHSCCPSVKNELK